MRATTLLACVLNVLTVMAAPAETITQADLLRRMIDLERLMLPPAPAERAGLSSSFDRRQTVVRDGRYAQWDANNDRGQFAGAGEDGWKVMARIDGPGAITRIWCDQIAGKIRVILDGETVIDAPLGDLFNGVVEPFGLPLSYEIPPERAAISHFPIGFAKSCRVLCQDFDGEYQIDTLTFPPGTVVERFTTQLNAPARAALDEVIEAFKLGLTDKQLFRGQKASPHGEQRDLKGGEKLAWDLTGGGTIRAFYVSLTDKHEPREMYALHNLLLRIFWDGSAVPDVEVPLAAFFGTGFERYLYKSLVMGTDLGTQMPGQYANEGWFMYCYFPMPFANGARIEIENVSPQKGRKIGVMLYMRVDKTPPPANALRFKVRMNKEDPCKTFDFPVLATAGAGRLVGCVLNIDCPREQWWGEGDHKIWIDNEPVPSVLGTSTAGYFGNVKGLRPFRMPLHGATLVSPIGKNSVYRWLLGDSVAFTQSLRFTLENWQYQQADDVYYNSVAYWYGEPGAADSFQRVSQDALELPGLRIPGSVEIEENIAGTEWGNVLKQKYAGGIELSGKQAATITTTDPIQVTLPWDKPGRYRLHLRVLSGRSFDTVTVADASGKPIGTVQYDRESDGTYPVGEITITSDKTILTVACSKTVSLDCWVLERVGE